MDTTRSKTVNRAAEVRVATPLKSVQRAAAAHARATTRSGETIQRMGMRVSSPNDPAEREAVTVARNVMRMSIPESSIAVVPGAQGGVFRQVGSEKEKKEKERKKLLERSGSPSIKRFAHIGALAGIEVQRKMEGTPDISANVATDIQSSMASGSPLPVGVRRFMEPRFGADFRNVRVHTGEKAAQLNRNVNAHAFAVGNHIFFGRNKFRPDSPDGRELIAHELTHTIQQGGAVQRSADVTVTQSAPVHVQRGLISEALDFFADKANMIPGFRMFTIILGVNPVNMSSVDRSAANIFRALVEFIPGGGLITRALDNYGIFEKAGAWVDTQIRTLGMVGSSFRSAVMQFIDTLDPTDVFRLGSVWERAKRIFTEPIGRIIAFAAGLATGLLDLIKDAILRPIGALAAQSRGWDLVRAVLGRDPITGDPFPRNADTLIGGFMKLIGQEEIWNNLKKANAVARAWAWFQGALSALLGFVQEIPTLFINALKSLTVADVIVLPMAYIKIGKAFGDFVGRFITWAGNAVWNLLEIIFDVVSPGAFGYVKRTGAALRSILRNPLPFVGNLVRAAKTGFKNFGGNFLTHLKAGLIDWLTGSLPGVYIPKGFTLGEIVRFVFSILGVSWANIRQKLVKVVGETAVKAMEVGFDIVVTLVTQGPAAAWEKIKEQLANLKDAVIGGITSFVVETVVTKAIPKLIAMFIPGAGFISAIISIYDTVMVFVNKISKIIQVVTGFINSIVAIAAGNIGAAAARVESILAGLLSLAINFLAGFVGLGKVADKIMGVINKVRAAIDKAIDWLINWIVTMARKLGRFVAQAGVPNDPNERLRLGMAAAVSAVDRLGSTPLSHAVINPLLGAIKVRYAFTELKAVEENGEWFVEGSINPKRRTRISKAARAKAASIAGQNITSVTPATLGPEYTKRPYLGLDEVQASSGFSGKVPVLHVDETDIIRVGLGPYRSDYVLIKQFNAEIAKIEADLAKEVPPIALVGDKGRPEKDLRDKTKSTPQFAHGIRRQMKATIAFLQGPNRLTFRGVEVPLGAGNRSIDFTITRTFRGKEINALVEVKNWSGTYDPKELATKVTRLTAQLTAYIDLAKAGTNDYSMLILDWYGFNSLDATAKKRLQKVVDDARAYARGKVSFRFNKL